MGQKTVFGLIQNFTVTYCYRLYGPSEFSNWHAVLPKLLVWQKKRKFGTVVNISVKIWKLLKTWKYKNLMIKNSKSRNYI